MHMSMLPAHMYRQHMCLYYLCMPGAEGSQKMFQFLWNWSNKHFWATM